MKTTKEKADELVEKYLQLDILVSESEGYLIMRNSDAVQCAVLSVKHTIDYLKLISRSFIIDPNKKYAFDVIAFSIYEQEQLLAELESRL